MSNTAVFTLDNMPKNTNLVNFSLLQNFHSAVPFRSFSIKYVVEGCENYAVNGKNYAIKTGNYLLANNFSEGYVEIESKTNVVGICIDIEPVVLSEVVASFRRPDTAFVDLDLDTFFNSPNFLENSYECRETNVGLFLQNLDFANTKKIYQTEGFSKDFYFAIAEKVVADHIPTFKELQNIATIKLQTRKDLWRRINQSKVFIDTYFAQIANIQEIAKEVGMSEYHFFRTFKAVYGISPHQYLLHKRLEYAHKILKNGNFSVSEAALETGFGDIYAFSKAFKKLFGYAPSLKS
jgi:AraC family transcriptional regulator